MWRSAEHWMSLTSTVLCGWEKGRTVSDTEVIKLLSKLNRLLLIVCTHSTDKYNSITLKCLHGHVVMSFANFQNVHTIITTDSMNVSVWASSALVFCSFGLVCVRLWMCRHKHLNDTNNVIRTLCTNYTNTCSQIDDSTGFVRIEKFCLEITLSFEHSAAHTLFVRIHVFRMCVCARCFDGQEWFTCCLIPLLFPQPSHYIKLSSMT